MTECNDFQERTNWSMQDVCEGLDICMQSSYFAFRGKYIKQVFRTPMGSPVSPTTANLLMEDIENTAMTAFHHPPKVWKRYVDDSFVVIAREYLQQFFNFLNGIETAVHFTEENAFLDVKLTRENIGYSNYTVYRKPTHADRCLNFRSDHPLQQKSGY